jgi:beta-mannosidase
MGEQALYNYAVELVVAGEVVDLCEGRLGIREVEILEEPFTEEAGPGISFWITINGERVFCKGGNWIPQELWPAEATEEQYRFHLQKAAEAHFNMLRVWGGGIYERDIFYDLCDELSIMVWQDFMFASAGYPVDLLRGEIIAEAQHQIARLRNRPCICLWCGCNEDVYSWGPPNEEAADSLAADTGVCSEPHESVRVNRLRDDPQIYSPSSACSGTTSACASGSTIVSSADGRAVPAKSRNPRAI